MGEKLISNEIDVTQGSTTSSRSSSVSYASTVPLSDTQESCFTMDEIETERSTRYIVNNRLFTVYPGYPDYDDDDYTDLDEERTDSLVRHFSWTEKKEACGLWNCPLDQCLENAASGMECPLCLQQVPSTALLPCVQCHQSVCAVCLLRVVASHDATSFPALGQINCGFCRNPFPQLAIVQLVLLFKAHRSQLPFQLFNPQHHARPVRIENQAVRSPIRGGARFHYDTEEVYQSLFEFLDLPSAAQIDHDSTQYENLHAGTPEATYVYFDQFHFENDDATELPTVGTISEVTLHPSDSTEHNFFQGENESTLRIKINGIRDLSLEVHICDMASATNNASEGPLTHEEEIGSRNERLVDETGSNSEYMTAMNSLSTIYEAACFGDCEIGLNDCGMTSPSNVDGLLIEAPTGDNTTHATNDDEIRAETSTFVQQDHSQQPAHSIVKITLHLSTAANLTVKVSSL